MGANYGPTSQLRAKKNKMGNFGLFLWATLASFGGQLLASFGGHLLAFFFFFFFSIFFSQFLKSILFSDYMNRDKDNLNPVTKQNQNWNLNQNILFLP
jgi:4-hydroxybenzoate polyprenyltransferase